MTRLSRRQILLSLPAVAALLAACAGDEDDGGRQRATANTPVVIRNQTPVFPGGTSDPAAIAATAAAQAAAVSGVPPPPAGAKPPAAAPGTPVPAAPPPGAAPGPPPAPPGAAKPDAKPVTRLGIVQPAWETLRLKEQELNGQVRLINTAEPDDYQRNIDQLIRSGINIVVTVGVDLSQVTQEAAEKNPSVKFIGVDQYQDRVLPNLVGFIFDDDRAGFLAGALAGLMTKSNIVGGVVGPGWMSTMVSMGEGFASGAEYVNPNVEVFLEYHPGELPEGLNDQKWGRETTQQMLTDGADVIFAAGGKTGQAALEIARGKNVFAIGSEIDQYDAFPAVRPVLLTSVVKVLSTPAMAQLVKGFSEGTVKGGNVVGDIQIAAFREAEPKIPRTVRERLQTIERGLKQGSVKTGVQTH